MRQILSAWLRLGLALAFAIALAAVQLLPTAEYLEQSQRAGSVGYDFAMTYSFWPWRFLTLFAPDMFGSPAQGNYWGYGNYWEDALYIGMLPMLMAVGVVLRALRRTADRRPLTAQGDLEWIENDEVDDLHGRPPSIVGRRSSVVGRFPGLVPFLAALILLSFALALGKNTVIYPWLYRHIPTFDMFQAPTRFSLWAEFGLALLAGWGVNAWKRPAGRGLYWTRLGTAGAFAVMLGTGLAWLFLGDITPTFLRATALGGMLAMGVGALSLLAPRFEERRSSVGSGSVSTVTSSRSNLWAWAVVLFICADLLLAHWGLNPGTELSLYTRPSENFAAARAMAGDHRIYLPADDEYELKFNRFFSFKSFQPGDSVTNLREVLLPDTHLLEGLASVNNFDPLVPGRFSSWMEALEDADPQSRRTLLNLMDVGVVVKVDPMQAAGVRLDTSTEGQRLRWATCAYPSSGSDDALGIILSGRVDPDTEAVVEGVEAGQGAACPVESPSNQDPNADVVLITADPDRLVVHVNASSDGWLVLSDVWYPGWQARIDGRSAPLARANYLFRAVPVPAGEHEVIFVYRPASFYLGALISLAGWAGLAGLGIWRWREALSRRASESRTRRSAAALSHARIGK